MTTVTARGNRLEQLKNLAAVLAAKIDETTSNPDGAKQLPQLARQYRETIREIEEIEGASKNDDKIGELLSARHADGKSDAVR